MKNLYLRLRRLVGFVDQLKREQHPTATSYAHHLQQLDADNDANLAVSPRTIKRDIAYLRDTMHCPLEYDAAAGGYLLVDPTWTFPLQALGGPAFPYLLGENAASTRPGYREGMYAPIVLADRDSVDVQALLPLITATHGTPQAMPDITEAILYSWSECRQVRLTYGPRQHQRHTRDIDPHRLISNEGIWYVRAWCHLRQAPRTFALHRIDAAKQLSATFEPRQAIDEETQSGNALGLEEVENVIVRVRPERAAFYAEREWFAGQFDRHLPDGTLELLFPRAPRPVIIG